MDIPINPRDMVDLNIYNFIGLTVNIDGTDNAKRLKRAPLLEVSAAAWEVSKFESLPWIDMAARAKLKAETGLSEQKTIFG